MYRSNDNRIFPMILIAVVVIALVAGLVTVGRYLFSGTGNSEEVQSRQEVAREQLTTANTDSSVRMTIRGPLVADENFRSYRISISPDSRNYAEYSGYLDEELDTKSYPNNRQAYVQFVHALDKAAFTKEGKYSEEEAGDLRGICATGLVYEFEIMNGDDATQSYWTSTCKGSQGTFGASVDQVKSLFRSQIPAQQLNLGDAGRQPFRL